mgnify:CR=1 FL=1
MFELTKIQTIKFYTYKHLLYILIKFNIITYNKKNELLTKCHDNMTMTKCQWHNDTAQ